MSSSDVSAVTNHFAPANEGFSTTTSTLTVSGGTSIGLLSVTGLTNGNIFVGVIEPGTVKEQVFTGTIDTAGSQITGVKWTKGTNVEHSDGVSVVDYDTGTSHNMMVKGLLVQHKQSGAHSAVTADSVTTSGGVTVGGALAVAGATTHTGAISGAGYSLATMSNPYKFSAWGSVTTVIAAGVAGAFGAATKVTFGTELYDTGSNFASNAFTAPVTGYYFLNTQVEFFVTNAVVAQIIMYKNGVTSIAYSPQVYNGTGGNNTIAAAITKEVFLTAGDYVEVFGRSNQTSTCNTTVGLEITRFEGSLRSLT